jgi:hypothetical protein
LKSLCSKAKFLDDFGDVKKNFLNKIEEEFEYQLNWYVELVNMIDFDFYISIYV